MTETIRYAWGQSSLGKLLAAMSARGLVMMEFNDPGSTALDALTPKGGFHPHSRLGPLSTGQTSSNPTVRTMPANVDTIRRLGSHLRLDGVFSSHSLALVYASQITMISTKVGLLVQNASTQ